jgi:hypothetical protein
VPGFVETRSSSASGSQETRGQVNGVTSTYTRCAQAAGYQGAVCQLERDTISSTQAGALPASFRSPTARRVPGTQYVLTNGLFLVLFFVVLGL